jgi:hypothetical protein
MTTFWKSLFIIKLKKPSYNLSETVCRISEYYKEVPVLVTVIKLLRSNDKISSDK